MTRSSWPAWLLTIVFLLIAMPSVQAQVRFSELQWAGSDASIADEWIELVMIDGSGSALSLSGWTITAGDNLLYRFSSGQTIASGQYLLLSNYSAEQSALSVAPDIVVTSISLSNADLFLELRNASGEVIDVAGAAGEAPLAGYNKTASGIRATMQRIRFDLPGDDSSAWADADTFIGFDSGALVLGTPGYPAGAGTAATLLIVPQVDKTGSGVSASGDTVPVDPPVGTGLVFSGASAWRLSEILANPVGSDDLEWIELEQTQSGAVSLSGLTVSDGSRNFKLTDSALAGTGTQTDSMYRFFTKEVTGLSLPNKGKTLSLWSGSLLLDIVTYPETGEGISYARSASGSWQPFCQPTPGLSNTVNTPAVGIEIQSHNGHESGSGALIGTGSLTLNLTVAASGSGSLDKAQCHWNFGDDFTSDSCNPPSHKISKIGSGEVSLKLTDYCDSTVKQAISYTIIEKPKKTQKISAKASEKIEQKICSITAVDGIKISEIVPNPYGPETSEEWIELYNNSPTDITLCQWQLDDEDGGSKSFDLSDLEIAAGSYLVVTRPDSKLALNNPGDSVRLLNPNQEIVDEVSYAKAPEGESYAWRDDGFFVWTPFLTPGTANKFRTAERQYDSDIVVVSAALPNPVGKDELGEWIEISNVSASAQFLTGWSLDNKPGSSAPFDLSEITIAAGQTIRFTIDETRISLVNSSDQVRLLDPDGYTVSTFGWIEAVEGRIYRRPVLTSERATARVVNVVDGDTIDIALADPDEFSRLPSSLVRRWLALAENGTPSIRVRLIGIDTPETVHPTKEVQSYGLEASARAKELLAGQTVSLAFDQEIWDKYNRLLAYVYLNNNLVQSQLLREGLAYAYLRFPFLLQEQFMSYEAEARQALLGIWSNDTVAAYADMQQADVEAETVIEKSGLSLTIKPAAGLVDLQTTVSVIPSVPAEIFISVNSGAFIPFSGSYLISGDVNLQFYAERQIGTGVVLSAVEMMEYTVRQPDYHWNISLSEVFPSPKVATGEWLELVNPTAKPVSLTGWQIDDERNGGSKPWVVGPGVSVPASGRLLLSREQTGLALNNDGDEVWFISPDGTEQAGYVFGRVQTDQSVIWHQGESCVTDVATPLAANICRQLDGDGPDADGDYLSDELEDWRYETSPDNPDSDSDGWLDGFEVEMDEDPLQPTADTRQLTESYRSFVAKQTKPKVYQYKTKGIVIKGRPYPASGSVMIAGQQFVLPLRSDEPWELLIDKTLSPGQYPVSLQLTDAAGRDVYMPDIGQIDLEEPYQPPSVKASATSRTPEYEVLPVTYISEIEGRSEVAMDSETPEKYRFLRQLSTIETARLLPSVSVSEVTLVGFLFCLSVGLLHWRRRA